MSAQSLNLVATILIVLLTAWAALTHRVKTNSLEILFLGIVHVAALIGVIEALGGYIAGFSQIAMRTGLAGIGSIYFTKVEIIPRCRRAMRLFFGV